ILSGVPVDDEGQVLPSLGSDATDMPGNGNRGIETLPAHDLRAPGQVAVFAEGKEILIEKLSLHRDGLDVIATKESGSTAGTEDVLRAFVLTAIDLLGTTVEVPHIAREIDAGGVDDRGAMDGRRRVPAQQLAAERSNFRMRFAGCHQAGDEIGAEHDIGIQ